MKQTRIPPNRIETQHVPFAGGIDLETSVLSLKPGNVLEAMNYEPGPSGGYRRIDGYERYDGRPAPSAASYTYIECAPLGAVSVGATVTGATSAATGRVLRVDSALGAISVSKVVGTFVAGEQLTVGGVAVGTVSSTPSPRGYRDARGDAETLAAAADIYRSDIGAVPGKNPVRGVWMHLGVLYAFRDTLDGAACAMYRASAAGWVLVPFGEEVRFTNANTFVKDGAVLVQGTNNAVIRRVVIETGSLASGTNTGRIVLASRVGPGFAGGAATATGFGAGTLTLAAAQTAIRLLPGGRFECLSTNFGGASATYRMYGCDGMNRAFEFDGTTFVPITTGMESDRPKFIIEHKERLFLSFDASVQYSGDGNPFSWTILTGAGEIGVGENITGFAVQAGDTLAVFSRNSSSQLNGATSNTFQMLPISREVGAIPYSVQTIGKTYAMDDRGLVSTDRTNAWGNFVQSAISTRVQRLVDALRPKVAGSISYRNRSQYRVYGTDGSGLIATFGEQGLLGFTRMQYPVRPTCFASCEDSTGADVVFFGAEDGMVYRADIGSSFDGQPIEAYLRMPFNNVGGPRIRKRFRKAVLEMSATAYAEIRFQPEFSYGDPDVGTHRVQSGEIAGAGGYWDVDLWDTFFYDAQVVSNPAFSIEGTGLNMSLVFYSASAIDSGHALQGVIIHYSLKRLER